MRLSQLSAWKQAGVLPGGDRGKSSKCVTAKSRGSQDSRRDQGLEQDRGGSWEAGGVGPSLLGSTAGCWQDEEVTRVASGSWWGDTVVKIGRGLRRAEGTSGERMPGPGGPGRFVCLACPSLTTLPPLSLVRAPIPWEREHDSGPCCSRTNPNPETDAEQALMRSWSPLKQADGLQKEPAWAERLRVQRGAEEAQDNVVSRSPPQQASHDGQRGAEAGQPSRPSAAISCL